MAMDIAMPLSQINHALRPDRHMHIQAELIHYPTERSCSQCGRLASKMTRVKEYTCCVELLASQMMLTLWTDMRKSSENRCHLCGAEMGSQVDAAQYGLYALKW